LEIDRKEDNGLEIDAVEKAMPYLRNSFDLRCPHLNLMYKFINSE